RADDGPGDAPLAQIVVASEQLVQRLRRRAAGERDRRAVVRALHDRARGAANQFVDAVENAKVHLICRASSSVTGRILGSSRSEPGCLSTRTISSSMFFSCERVTELGMLVRPSIVVDSTHRS